MKIAILGTKGIPNNYGGYEQFAEYISVRLIERGHEVTVYNPGFHKFKDANFKGVKIIRKFSPENLLGGAANIIYDYLCLRDALKRDFDVIYEAGYHSVAPAYRWLGVKELKKPVIVTNMDGLEWKRSKWAPWIQRTIKRLEEIAVKESPFLISDNLGISEYLEQTYGASSFYIPYGADAVMKFDPAMLNEFSIKPGEYFMLVARMEPENNIETVIKGYIQSKSKYPLLVVGNTSTKFGVYLTQTYKDERIRFVGGIYQKAKLDALRNLASGYFHGHSVGGTNPSLLEAMACQCFIIAHRNPFNRAILDNDALYFDNSSEVTEFVENIDRHTSVRKDFVKSNLIKIEKLYNWDVIVRKHEELFLQLQARNAR
jgi:glycosyltransferase involved in cell wall biosynthesis